MMVTNGENIHVSILEATYLEARSRTCSDSGDIKTKRLFRASLFFFSFAIHHLHFLNIFSSNSMEPRSIISRKFMRGLLRCHLLQKQARKQVKLSKRSFKNVLKAFKWQHQIRKQITTDVDIVRRNLWLTIVRNDILRAYSQRAAFREHKIKKSRSIALQCEQHHSASRQQPMELSDELEVNR